MEKETNRLVHYREANIKPNKIIDLQEFKYTIQEFWEM